MITAGQTAPDFTLPRDGGATVTLSALRPGKVVLYFYPKDDTPAAPLRRRTSTPAWPNSPLPGQP
jgi:thioredoxin-dependent peroxiredoxin